MSYKPDYGLRLKNNGISQEVESVTQNFAPPRFARGNQLATVLACQPAALSLTIILPESFNDRQ